MARKRILALLLFLTVSPVVSGCMGGSDSGDGRRSRTASRGRLSIGKGKRGDLARADRRGQRALDDFSPEGSMERDLQALREREKIQERKIKELQGGLDQRNDLVQREQEKLDDIRKRIDSYDTAIQRYEMAARSRPPREVAGEPSVVPAEMFEERGSSNSPVAYSNDDYTPDNPFSAPPRETRTLYSVEAKPAYSNLPVREYRSDRPSASVASAGYSASPGGEPEYETVIYAPPAVETTPNRETRVITAPGSVPPMSRKNVQPEVNRFAGAPVGRSNQASRESMLAKQAREEQAGSVANGWSAPNNLFSKTSTPSVPAYPTPRNDANLQLDQAVREKALAASRPAQQQQVSAMAAPAQTQAQGQKQFPKTEFKLQTKPEPAKQETPVQAAPAVDDEVFTPDLFLSGS